MLQQAKEELEAKPEHVVVRTYSADVTDSHVLEQVARDFGHWDILISNAAYMPASASVEMADSSDWWTAFEVMNLRCFDVCIADSEIRSTSKVALIWFEPFFLLVAQERQLLA